MSKIGIIAAGGESKRTGLSAYTTKAALRLGGKSLLGHQLDFFRRSGAERVFVVCRPEHVRVLGKSFSSEDRRIVAFILSDAPTGWAGEVERVAAFVSPDDEVILISCDNLHAGVVAEALGSDVDAVFTYTSWDSEQAPTSGPVLARVTTAWGNPNADMWMQKPGAGFVGDFFTGYAVVRGSRLVEVLRDIPRSDRGEKEITSLLEVLAKSPRYRAIPYPGLYDDVADIPTLARIAARLREDGSINVASEPVGACVLLHDTSGRVLLVEREDGRGWVPPGGIVDIKETYARAAIRETREEVGIVVGEDDLRLLGVYPTAGKVGGPACTIVFHARVRGDAKGYANSQEVRRVGWFTRKEVESMPIPFHLSDAVLDHFDGRSIDVRGV